MKGAMRDPLKRGSPRKGGCGRKSPERGEALPERPANRSRLFFILPFKGLGKNVMSGKAPRFALDLDDLRAKSRKA
jgi:hypothetical protein